MNVGGQSCLTSNGPLHANGGFRREVQPRRQHWFLNEKVGFPRPHPRLLLGFQGTKSARREGISSPFNDAGGCTSPQNSGRLRSQPRAQLLWRVRGKRRGLPSEAYSGHPPSIAKSTAESSVLSI